MGTVYVCGNPECDNDEEYGSPGTCPDCGEELEATLALTYDP